MSNMERIACIRDGMFIQVLVRSFVPYIDNDCGTLAHCGTWPEDFFVPIYRFALTQIIDGLILVRLAWLFVVAQPLSAPHRASECRFSRNQSQSE